MFCCGRFTAVNCEVDGKPDGGVVVACGGVDRCTARCVCAIFENGFMNAFRKVGEARNGGDGLCWIRSMTMGELTICSVN